MVRGKERLISTTALAVVLGAGLFSSGFAMAGHVCQPKDVIRLAANANKANPCAVTKTCNPCAGQRACKPCGAKAACNPSAVKKGCGPCGAKKACNPCGAANPCSAAGLATECVIPRLAAAYRACNPCAVKKACGPCAAGTACNPCGAKKNCNPCAAKKACNPCTAKKTCNPCAVQRTCNPCTAKKTCNPCAATRTCNPCAAKKTCNPCNPCAADGKVPPELSDAEAVAAYDCVVPHMTKAYAKSCHPAGRAYRSWARFSMVSYPAEAHGVRFMNNYANEIASGEYGKWEAAGAMPPGSVLAKDSFIAGDDGSLSVGPLFLMAKGAAGSNAATRDWTYSVIMPTGTVREDAATQEFCNKCHRRAGAEDDNLMFLPLPYRIKTGG